MKGSEYDPKRFPGLIYKLKEPKTALLLFTSGKLVCTGANTVDMVHEAVDKVLNMITELGIDIPDRPEIHIQNIVATTELDTTLNINKVALTLGLENVEYEPEQFPGMVYRVRDPKVVALLFSSGKMVLTGASKIEDIHLALEKIMKELKDDGIL